MAAIEAVHCVLAPDAKRAGVKDIIMCYENEKDVKEINPDYIKGVNFHYVKQIKEVLDFALV